MTILEKEILIGLNSQTVPYYIEKGYDIPRVKDINGISRVKRGTKILVKVEDLPINSLFRVTKICDLCGKKVETSYHKILKGRKSSNDGQDKCKECSDRLKFTLINNARLEVSCVAKTHPEFSKCFWDQNDTYAYTHQSNKKTDFICPECGGRVKNKRIQDVYKYGLSCVRCSDGYSYSEKFMFNLLHQLNIDFETQKSFKWSNDKRYDFFISSISCIIETHGEQHYLHTGFSRTLDEEQNNDNLKEKLAKGNSIEEYIVIDCIESKYDYIKNNIINSNISRLFDLSNVDFLKCHEFASKSILKEVSNLYNGGFSNTEIGNKLKIHRKTVSRYLKRAEELGWCIYVAHSSRTRSVVQLTMSGEYVSEFESTEIAKKMTNSSNISNACKGRSKSSGGFIWMYKEDYEAYLEKNKTKGGIK